MNVRSFLDHYGIRENPFLAEEAGQDSVFLRIENVCRHPDFEKIRGDLDHPSSSIVFGERGSGKTAIRLQIEQAVEEYNVEHAERRCLVVPYDDLNPVLDRFARHVGEGKGKGRGKGRSATDALSEFKLVDHMDAMLERIVPAIVDQILGKLRGARPPLMTEKDAVRHARQFDHETKIDLLLLQMCYDRPESAGRRTADLKRAIRHRSANVMERLRWSAIVLGVLGVGGIVTMLLVTAPMAWLWWIVVAVVSLAALGLGARWTWLWFRVQQVARDLAKSLRVLDRTPASLRASLRALHPDEAFAADLPRSLSDEARYAMFNRLLGVIRPFGYQSMIILVDRVDEPTMISGEPDHMQALVWSMLNNKFLQQSKIGLKLLLPLELRFRLGREGTELFREARLDKQNFVDRLTWSGAMLYDLCTARVNACRAAEDDPLSIMEFFDASITHQDIVDALDQMQQPRDAFKFLYALVQEHCSNVPEERPEWKIARQTLDSVRKAQSDRMTAMLRGVQPA